MGRELKRVALDFQWPLHKQWNGYVNPHYRKCPDCERGYSPAGEWLAKGVQDLVWRLPEDSDVAALTTKMCGRAPRGPLGHDSCDAYSAQQFILKAAGMPDGWGICKTCEGEAQDPTTKAEYEAWRKTDPPAGPGFQLWETTSEGSPISPVFDSLDALCAWCAGNATTFGSMKATAEQWKRMLEADLVAVEFAPGMVAI